MNGMRTVGPWAFGHMGQVERSSFRIMGTARSYSMKGTFQCELTADRRNRQRTVTLIKPEATHRFFSQSSESTFGKKGRNFWSAVAAGLLGLGGVSLICDSTKGDLHPSKDGFFASKALRYLLPRAHCDRDANCGCGGGGGDDKKVDKIQQNNDNKCQERKCETSDCLRKTDCEEEIIQKANCELEKALKDTKGKAVDYTENALKAYCDAIAAIKEFMNKVYCAVEDEDLESPHFDQVWADVYKSLKTRCDLAKIAMEKGSCAWELLKRLREVIEAGKTCRYTSCHPLLVTAEETLVCAETELCAKKTEMETLLKESRPVEQYRNLVEEFRRDLKAEAESLVPNDCCRVTLNDNEANMVLTHAYKKILRIQKEMSSDGCM